MNSECPSKVGPYVIHEKLGSGGMGTVYLGYDEKTDEPAAIKVLPASLAREEGFVERFSREINALQQLKNPHIVELKDSGEDAETCYYAMEYVQGETMAQRLRRERRIPWDKVIEWAVQICSALKAAHDLGIVHRDLKPTNLMLTPDDRVKLTDFGVAQVFAANRLTMTGGIIGTATYMSPEQAQGRRATKHSDLYSLGVVMYVMLTGQPPFTGKTTLDVLHKHQYGRFDLPSSFVPDIPQWLEEIICKLLEKDPQDRYPDAYVLSLRLKEVVNKVQVSSQEATVVGEIDDGSATTAAASQSVSRQVVDAGPGAATLMRDLMKVEIERSQQPSRIGNFFNNTWVLTTSLIVLIAGGFWWFRPQEPTAEERFQTGVAMLEQPEGPAWLTARDNYLLPLVQEDPQGWEDRVQPFLTQIDDFELERRLGERRPLRKTTTPKGDAERFLALAQRYMEMGDFARAERILVALEALLENEASFAKLYNLSQRRLQDLRTEKARDHAFLKNSTARAQELLKLNRLDEARRILDGIVELYSADDSASEYVEQARQLIEKQTMADQ